MKLTEDHKTQEDAIEIYFCPLLKNKNTQPLTKDQSEIFMQISMASMMGTPVPIPADDTEEFEKLPFEAKVLIKRTTVFDFEITDLGIVFLLIYLAGNLGGIVMYLTMIQQFCKINNKKVFEINDFVAMFPMGIYSKEDLHTAWDAQKVPGQPDNLLDYPTALTSLRF